MNKDKNFYRSIILHNFDLKYSSAQTKRNSSAVMVKVLLVKEPYVGSLSSNLGTSLYKTIPGQANS